MNKVMLVGRICNDLELRYTNNDKAVVEFSLATNRPVMRDGERVTDFITCVVFGGQAENLTKYQGKGSMIGVEGSYRVDTYQDKDGNNRYKHYVLASSVEFLGSKKTTDTPDETPVEEVKEESNPYEEFGQQIQITDADLPF
jgi:single-strand DNA-binding protein